MAHINEWELLSELTLKQRLHLKQCDYCQENKQLIEQVTSDSNKIKFETPPAQVWQKISKTRQPTAINKRTGWHLMTASAATIMLAIFGWLSWNNYLLQTQFNEVLVMNQLLEKQLTSTHSMHFSETRLLDDLIVIEQKLLNANKLSEKVDILNERKLQINKIILLQKGKSNEYQI